MSEIENLLQQQALRGEAVYHRAVAHVEAAGDTDSTERVVNGIRVARRKRRGTGLAATVLAVAAIGVGAALVSPTVQEPADPPPQSGDVVWKSALGSESWSSPALVSAEIAVVGANDGVVRGLDIATGAVLWEVPTGGDIRGAVVASGGVAYASSEDGSLYAISASGELLWTAPVSSPVVSHDSWQPLAAAPLVIGGSVCLGDHDARMTCFDREVGTVLWTTGLGGGVSSQAASDGDTLFVGAADARLYALDLETGAQLWTAEVPGEVATAPAVAGGVVVVGSRGTAVVGLDAADGALLWEVSMGTSWAESAPAVADGVAYFGSSLGGHVTAADVATGAVMWRVEIGGMPWARPGIGAGVVYATAVRTASQEPTDSAVFAIDRHSGVTVWEATTGPALTWAPEGAGYGVGTEPLVTESLVIVSALDGHVYAFAR